MTETLLVRWKPGTLDTLLVTTERGTQECPRREIEAQFGRQAMNDLYLKGRVTLVRAVPQRLPVPTKTSAA